MARSAAESIAESSNPVYSNNLSLDSSALVRRYMRNFENVQTSPCAVDMAERRLSTNFGTRRKGVRRFVGGFLSLESGVVIWLSLDFTKYIYLSALAIS